jgi:hypothetical protein
VGAAVLDELRVGLAWQLLRNLTCGSGVAEKLVVLCLNLKQVLNHVIIMMDAPLHVLN